jgi:serine/threonine protein kinase
LMLSILKDHPIAVSEIRGDVPEGIAQLIARCLEKDPRVRVQTAQEILIELRAHRRVWESGTSSGTKPRTSSAVALPTGESRFRIAVLPFQSRTANSDAVALADGLTDDVTAGLARFPYLRFAAGCRGRQGPGCRRAGGRAGWRAISAGRNGADGG